MSHQEAQAAEDLEIWRGILRAIKCGQSCLSPEVQKLLKNLIVAGCNVSGELFDEDGDELWALSDELHQSIHLFNELYNAIYE